MSAQMANTPIESAGWLDTVKNVLNPEKLMQRFNISKEQLIDMGLYMAAGFLAGFLLKKYIRFVLTVVFCVLVLFLMNYGNFISITINWARFQDVGLGAVPAQLDATLFSVYWEWVKMHVGVVLSFSVGFLFGLKIG